MDLNDEPIAPPIISESIVVKPENQNNITKSNGNKNISFFYLITLDIFYLISHIFRQIFK